MNAAGTRRPAPRQFTRFSAECNGSDMESAVGRRDRGKRRGWPVERHAVRVAAECVQRRAHE